MPYDSMPVKHLRDFVQGPETPEKKHLRDAVSRYANMGRSFIYDGVRYYLAHGRICCVGQPGAAVPSVLRILDGAEQIVPSAFCKEAPAQFTKVIIPDTVDFIGNGAFSGCDRLEEVSIHSPALLLYYGNIFSGCVSLRELDLRSTNVTLIPQAICYNCAALKRVYLPPTVTEIGRGAFSLCYNLEEIYLPRNVKIGSHAFSKSGSPTGKKTKKIYYN